MALEPAQPRKIDIARAQRRDASEIAILSDMAGHGLPAYFWAISSERAEGMSLLEFGRARARRDTGMFSWSRAWIARVDGQVAGMVLGYRQPDDLSLDLSDVPDLAHPLVELEALAPGSWYLNILAVYPEYRARGIGGLLIDHVIGVAREEGAPSISLIVEDMNESARRLYLRMGFEEKASRPYRPFPMGPAAKQWVLMVRELR